MCILREILPGNFPGIDPHIIWGEEFVPKQFPILFLNFYLCLLSDESLANLILSCES